MNQLQRALILSGALAAIAVLPAPATAAPHCHGHEATVLGSKGRDRIVAQPGDVIVARGGNDLVAISDRGVVACLGSGRDAAEFSDTTGGDAHVYGQAGNDRIAPITGDLDYAQVYLRIVADGGGGDDLLIGGYADDRLSGGTGDDEIIGNHRADTIDGNGGDDRLFGNNPRIEWVDGRNRISGGSGDDRIFGGYKDDRLRGDDGADRLKGNGGDDTAIGGSGRDRCEAERKRGCEL